MTDLQELTQAVGKLDEAKVKKLLKEFIAQNPDGEEVNTAISACQQGMTIVGDYFEKGEYFIGDLIFAGELLHEAFDTLKPIMAGQSTSRIGKIVLGTAKGDLHDVGKNIFKNMADAGGFEVYDLGVDISPETFVEKVKEHDADILGISGLLTLAMDSMKNTVDAFVEAGIRDRVKIIIGGTPVTKEYCETIGADAFTVNAAKGVEICRSWV